MDLLLFFLLLHSFLLLEHFLFVVVHFLEVDDVFLTQDLQFDRVPLLLVFLVERIELENV